MQRKAPENFPVAVLFMRCFSVAGENRQPDALQNIQSFTSPVVNAIIHVFFTLGRLFCTHQPIVNL
jgi:hypothetical protein